MIEYIKEKIAKRNAKELMLLFNSKGKGSAKLIDKVFNNTISLEIIKKQYSDGKISPKINFLEMVSISPSEIVEEFIAQRISRELVHIWERNKPKATFKATFAPKDKNRNFLKNNISDTFYLYLSNSRIILNTLLADIYDMLPSIPRSNDRNFYINLLPIFSAQEVIVEKLKEGCLSYVDEIRHQARGYIKELYPEDIFSKTFKHYEYKEYDKIIELNSKAVEPLLSLLLDDENSKQILDKISDNWVNHPVTKKLFDFSFDKKLYTILKQLVSEKQSLRLQAKKELEEKYPNWRDSKELKKAYPDLSKYWSLKYIPSIREYSHNIDNLQRNYPKLWIKTKAAIFGDKNLDIEDRFEEWYREKKAGLFALDLISPEDACVVLINKLKELNGCGFIFWSSVINEFSVIKFIIENLKEILASQLSITPKTIALIKDLPDELRFKVTMEHGIHGEAQVNTELVSLRDLKNMVLSKL
jgi:hypothetical protein